MCKLVGIDYNGLKCNFITGVVHGYHFEAENAFTALYMYTGGIIKQITVLKNDYLHYNIVLDY